MDGASEHLYEDLKSRMIKFNYINLIHKTNKNTVFYLKYLINRRRIEWWGGGIKDGKRRKIDEETKKTE